MRIYIATKLENAAQHNEVRDALVDLGHEITYDWTTHGPVWGASSARIAEVQQLELDGVRDADLTIVLANDRTLGIPTGRGTHVELGVALALYKLVFMLGDRSVIKGSTRDTCAFYHHPEVMCFETVRELLGAVTIAEQVRELFGCARWCTCWHRQARYSVFDYSVRVAEAKAAATGVAII